MPLSFCEVGRGLIQTLPTIKSDKCAIIVAKKVIHCFYTK